MQENRFFRTMKLSIGKCIFECRQGSQYQTQNLVCRFLDTSKHPVHDIFAFYFIISRGALPWARARVCWPRRSCRNCPAPTSTPCCLSWPSSPARTRRPARPRWSSRRHSPASRPALCGAPVKSMLQHFQSFKIQLGSYF